MSAFEWPFIVVDKALVRRTRNLALIPPAHRRLGGKASYAEWGHVIGIFQGLIAAYAPANGTLVDIGCGYGLVPLAASQVFEGRIVGLDVDAGAIAYCSNRYPFAEFHHLDVGNPVYTPGQSGALRWPLDDESVDVVTALSVWTHLQGDEAVGGFAELARVLAPGAAAIVTFFVAEGAPGGGRFHNTDPSLWRFDVKAAPGWLTTSWATIPEQAVAITRERFDQLVSDAGLALERFYPGNWRGRPGLYFQDVAVLRR